MFPPEPIRTLMLPRSLRVSILAFLPEALNSAPVNEASWAKSLVPAEGNITPATVIKLLVMNRRREVVRVPGIMMAPDFCDSEKGCACIYGMHVQRHSFKVVAKFKLRPYPCAATHWCGDPQRFLCNCL